MTAFDLSIWNDNLGENLNPENVLDRFISFPIVRSSNYEQLFIDDIPQPSKFMLRTKLTGKIYIPFIWDQSDPEIKIMTLTFTGDQERVNMETFYIIVGQYDYQRQFHPLGALGYKFLHGYTDVAEVSTINYMKGKNALLDSGTYLNTAFSSGKILLLHY